MAYQQHAIVALSDIPPLVHAFAGTAGWTVTGTTAAPVVKRTADSLAFTLGANAEALSWSNGGESARIVSPKLNGTNSAPAILVPSKVYLFGSAQFIATVVEYGFNRYRHLYVGHANGRDTISGCTPYAGSNANAYPLSFRRTAYLFTGRQRVHAEAVSGGIKLTDGWRRFYTTDAANPYPNFGATGVIGGFLDDINDGYLARGRSSFAGAAILVPINLYAPVPVTNDTRFAPLGSPAGVRMVNMADIDPAYEFTIGSTDWMCFPATRKSAAQTVAQGPNGGWASDETSFYVGYAYPKN